MLYSLNDGPNISNVISGYFSIDFSVGFTTCPCVRTVPKDKIDKTVIRKVTNNFVQYNNSVINALFFSVPRT